MTDRLSSRTADSSIIGVLHNNPETVDTVLYKSTKKTKVLDTWTHLCYYMEN